MDVPFYSKHKFLILLLAIVFYFLATSCLDLRHYRYVAILIFSLWLIFSIYTIGGNKPIAIGALVLFVLSLVVTPLFGAEFYLNNTWLLLQLSLAVLFFIGILFFTLQYTFRATQVSQEILIGAICAYLLLGLVWSYFYQVIAMFNPGAFAYTHTMSQNITVNYTYYSFTTLTTLGYGDITPVAPIVKMLSWLEAATGQIYLTILVAYLVSRYVKGHD